jgi:hypothetical protein
MAMPSKYSRYFKSRRLCITIKRYSTVYYIAAWFYDYSKKEEYEKLPSDSTGGIKLDTSSLPSSAPGGRNWASLGSIHFYRDIDTFSRTEAPQLLKDTPYQIRQELLKEQRLDRIEASWIRAGYY